MVLVWLVFKLLFVSYFYFIFFILFFVYIFHFLGGGTFLHVFIDINYLFGKKTNVLFNYALNTFLFKVYGVEHMDEVK